MKLNINFTTKRNIFYEIIIFAKTILNHEPRKDKKR